jgi:two-component sensor histidine kinase/CheY-like chemotaxis protein
MVTSTWSRSERSNWTVAVAMPRAEFVSPFWFQAAALAAAGLVALGLSALLAFLFGRPIATRLALLADRAATMASGAPGVPPPGGITEIDVVRNAMDAASSKIREQDQHLRLLIAELDHRVKNMLASVQAIASRTFGRSPNTRMFSGRLTALAIAHDQLSRTLGRGSSLRKLVEAAVGAHQDESGRIHIIGPDLFLNPKATQGISLTLHELMTNSAKYGALSLAGGRLRIEWGTTEWPDPTFRLQWSEHDGPPVAPPSKSGFGSFLIEKLLVEELGASTDLQFRPEGVVFTLAVALERAIGEEGQHAAGEENPQPVATLARGSRVLLVEDETLVALQIVELLDSVGVKTTRASTVYEAEQVVGTGTFDAAILDVNLHGHTIFSVARTLLKQRTPILFVTGYDFTGMWPQDLRSVRRIGKPLNEHDFCRALGISRESRAAYAVAVR